MENRTIHIFTVAEVAKALHELKEQMVFIGGAVVGLYADSNWLRMQERYPIVLEK